MLYHSLRCELLAGCLACLAMGQCGLAAAHNPSLHNSDMDSFSAQQALSPRIEAEQLQPPLPLTAAITPATAVAPYIRALEQMATSPAGSVQPVLAEVKTPRDAAWLLGLLYLHGVGTGIHPALARHWFVQAWQQGHPLAPAGLAWCVLDGCGQRPQPQQASAWIAELRKTDPGRADYLEWIRNQEAAPLEVAKPNQQQDDGPRKPSALLLRSAGAKDPYGENELGMYLAATAQWDEARRLFASAASRSPAAQANLAWIDRHRQERRAASREQAAPLTAEQLFLRGRQFHRGDGVPVSYAEALRLYKMAADQGNVHSKKMLGLIYTRPTAAGDINIVWMQQLANVDITAEGLGTLLAPPPSPLLQRDATPLYDYLPKRLRAG